MLLFLLDCSIIHIYLQINGQVCQIYGIRRVYDQSVAYALKKSDEGIEFKINTNYNLTKGYIQRVKNNTRYIYIQQEVIKMSERKHEDLRVRKTKMAIRSAFEDMICEMDYNEISIKELAARAMINRKTFYLHYQDLDALLEELQDEVANEFLKRNVSYRNMSDIKHLIRVYFEAVTKQPLLHERLLCSGSYRPFSDEVNRRVMEHRRKANRGAFGLDELSENLVFAYYGANSSLLYRQWVEDGKKLPLEDLIDVATKLICDGMSAFVKK